MTWVEECLQQQKKVAASSGGDVTPVGIFTTGNPIWQEIEKAIESDVQEFNNDGQRQYLVSFGVSLINVIPKTPPVATAVIQIDNMGTINLTCPPPGQGIGRRGSFKIREGTIISLGDFVGQPAPADHGMTPGEFSKFVLKPVLFPGLS
jgi:hypothetical protein